MSLYSPLDLDSIFLIDLAGGAGIMIYLTLAILAFWMGRFNLGEKVVGAGIKTRHENCHNKTIVG